VLFAVDGGFAEYCAYPAEKLFHFENLSWEEASLFEAASCAVHGMDRIRPEVGSSILLIGAGPTGLCLAQLLKANGGAHMVIASNEGPKMELAKKLNCADEYVELSRKDPTKQWADLKAKYPYGFDVVVEASGSHELLEKAIDYCTRGGKLVYYGVYEKQALINVAPARVFSDEITMIGFVQYSGHPNNHPLTCGQARSPKCGVYHARCIIWNLVRWTSEASSLIHISWRTLERRWMRSEIRRVSRRQSFLTRCFTNRSKGQVSF
jgi:threonine dehydrogenase-like Zn-dependent dehydrogenase